MPNHPHGYYAAVVNDLRTEVTGSECKVFHPDGRVTTEPFQDYRDVLEKNGLVIGKKKRTGKPPKKDNLVAAIVEAEV